MTPRLNPLLMTWLMDRFPTKRERAIAKMVTVIVVAAEALSERGEDGDATCDGGADALVALGVSRAEIETATNAIEELISLAHGEAA